MKSLAHAREWITAGDRSLGKRVRTERPMKGMNVSPISENPITYVYQNKKKK